MNYYVSFLANGNPSGSMCVCENMTFAQLATSFCNNMGLKEDNKPTFSFNSIDIASESNQTLKELGIIPMCVIQVKTPKPFNTPAMNANFNNAGNNGNFQMNNNQMYMGNFGMNQGYYGNMNPGYYGNMNQAYYGNMNNQFMNFQNMNMGQNTNNQNMNMNMGQNVNNQNANNSGGDFLNITFTYKGSPIQIQSTSNVRFCDLYTNKFIVKAGNPQTPPSFYINNEKIDSTETKTLRELNICNQAIIQASDEGKDNNSGGFINIIFNCPRKKFTIQSTQDTKMCDLSASFCNKAGFVGQDLTYIVNSRKIDSTEKKTLRELGIVNQSKIEVVLTAEVIGA